MSKRSSGLGGNAPDFAKAFSLAFEFVGAVVLFWLLGRWIDNRFGTEPWAQVVGSVIGWVGGFLHIYYKLKGVGWEQVPGSRRPAAEGRTDRPAATQSESGATPSSVDGRGEVGTGFSAGPSGAAEGRTDRPAVTGQSESGATRQRGEGGSSELGTVEVGTGFTSDPAATPERAPANEKKAQGGKP